LSFLLLNFERNALVPRTYRGSRASFADTAFHKTEEQNMSAPKATFNFQNYRGVLPYSSELFGVYQPLLGWKSKRHERRFARGYALDPLLTMERLSDGTAPRLKIGTRTEREVAVGIDISFDPGQPLQDVSNSRSLLVNGLRKVLLDKFGEEKAMLVPNDELAAFLEPDLVTKLLEGEVIEEINRKVRASSQQSDATGMMVRRASRAASQFGIEDAKSTIEYEAKLASTFIQLGKTGQVDAIRKVLLPRDWKHSRAALLQGAANKGPLDQFIPDNPLDKLDPNFDLDRVALSPIGIVHLFRQYFFELDTFLGSPVGHVWLSPGTSLELIEVSTRKVIVEKSFEQAVESTKKSELNTTDKDEFSDAVKTDNQQDIKFGASVTASYAGVTASSNFDLTNTQKQAREISHKHMREQSNKLSSEIKSSYKTTFKTVTETTDVNSKRYVIQNPSPDKLQNYELRRKMRQVAVQVQDIGTYLCWQTYVDKPGDTLDLAKLVHIAQPADLDSIPHPDEPAKQEPVTKNYSISFDYENVSGSDEKDVVFYQGDDQEGGLNHNDKIIWERDYALDSAGLGYSLDVTSLRVTSQHSDVCAARVTPVGGDKVRISLDQVNFADQPSVKLQVTATWTAPAPDLAAYNKKMTDYTNARARLQEEAYNKAVKERITIASKIKPRPADELREEERITIYRHLIQEMLLPKGYGSKDTVPETKDTLAARHVLSELINSIFDVDKMLYFVAPEWWKPRHSGAQQNFGGKPPSAGFVGPVSVANQVGWDAASDVPRNNYFITEDSDHAKLGSSLGWVLQLDGDNLRNAFLNAPWVKAVMPIRPGKEKAALNWLKHVEGFNGIGPTDTYAGDGTDSNGNPLNGKPLVEVLDLLADSVAKKHQEELTTKAFDLTDPQLPHDPESTVTATPVDRVWEHGFNPLAGGFQARPLTSEDDQFGSQNFQTFDQWVEILPTDQVVPVVVEYDPKTGRLKSPGP
jgi:hypothetical protein